MTPSEFGALLKKRQCGAYLLYGQEQYLARRYLENCRRTFLEEGDTFNHIRLDEDSFSPERLLDAMQTLPVFADCKLIEISGVDFNVMSEGVLNELIEVLDLLPEYEYNTLLFLAAEEELDAGTAKKPSARLQLLSEHLTAVCFAYQTEARLNKWLGQHFAAQGVLASASVCSFLMRHSGTDMFALSAQAEKCAAYVLGSGRSEVTEDDVRAVASPLTEYDTFALGDALLSSNTDLALSVLNDRLRRKERPELILGGIASVYQLLLRIRVLLSNGMSPREIAAKTGLNAYRVEIYARSAGKRQEASLRHALSLCHETDQKLKTDSLDVGGLLTELIVTLALSDPHS